MHMAETCREPSPAHGKSAPSQGHALILHSSHTQCSGNVQRSVHAWPAVLICSVQARADCHSSAPYTCAALVWSPSHLACGIRLFGALAARKVDEIQLGQHGALCGCVAVADLQVHSEHAVAAAAVAVQHMAGRAAPLRGARRAHTPRVAPSGAEGTCMLQA